MRVYKMQFVKISTKISLVFNLCVLLFAIIPIAHAELGNEETGKYILVIIIINIFNLVKDLFNASELSR